jgi:anti-anti-sigma factor
MPGVELSTSAFDGHVVVALRRELDVTGAAEAEAAITALVARDQYLVIDMSTFDFIDCNSLGALLRARELAGHDDVFWVQASVDAAVASIARRRRRYPWRRLAVRTARLGRAAPSRTGTG